MTGAIETTATATHRAHKHPTAKGRSYKGREAETRKGGLFGYKGMYRDWECGRTKRFQAIGAIMQTVKQYYQQYFPLDDMGEDIDPLLTFMGLNGVLLRGEDVYEAIGAHDSLVRERLFTRLAELMGVDYEVIYDLWLERGR